jgi:hypothetical protein
MTGGAGMAKVNITALPGYRKPTKAMIQKAKDALGLDHRVKLPRCQAKSAAKVRQFERRGDFSHSAASHICDYCRCNFRAGYGTEHLGYGLCLVHEHSKQYTPEKAHDIAEAHKTAIQQGYLEGHNWQYEVEGRNGFVEAVRKQAEDCKGIMSLQEELLLLRSEIDRLVRSFKETGVFQERVKHASGKGESRREWYVFEEVDDVTKVACLTKLVTAVSKLSVDNLKITDDDVVSKAQFILFGKGILSLVERMAPDQKWYTEFVEEFKHLYQTVKTGRKA